MSDDTSNQSDGGNEEPDEEPVGGGGNGGREPDPVGYPSDDEGRLCFVTGDLIKEKAAALALGDCDALCDFADFVLRAVYWSGLCPEPSKTGPGGDCFPCATCTTQFQNCTLGYTICKRNHDACIVCPCTP